MATTINYQNNYDKFKQDFREDTGLNPNTDIAEYIAYFNARMNDKNYQMSFQLAEIFINRLDALPDTISLRIGEMLNDCTILKQILQK